MRPLTRYRSLLGVLIALAVLVPFAWAAPFSFSATVDGKKASATVDAFQDSGQAYISLEKLLRQLGGSAREAPGKLTMDFGGRSAVVSLNGTQVSTSSESFSLQFPVKEADGGPYIAVADLEKLFGSGFGVGIARTAEEPAPEATDEEEMGLLEEVAPAADAAAPDAPAEAAPAVPVVTNGAFLLVLDAGHGGSDTGIVSGNGVNEKDITLAVAQAVEKLLADSAGTKVVLTRADDKELSVTQRGAFAAQSKASLFVSLHTGGSTSPAAHGFEIFVQGAASSSAQAAGESQYLAEAAEKLLGETTGATSRGVRVSPMRVLGGLNMPAMLVEMGMLTTPAEESQLTSADYQQKLAAAIAELARQAAARAAGGAA